MKQVFSSITYSVEAEEINGQYVAWIIAEYVNKVLPEYNDTQKRLVCKRSEGGFAGCINPKHHGSVCPPACRVCNVGGCASL